jgi:MFS family permease
MISDLFEQQKRSTAMAILGLGAAAGAIFAPLFGACCKRPMAGERAS